MMAPSSRRFTLFLLITAALPALPQAARFDLTGPRIEIRVTRAGATLPIASVPNLQPGDQLWLHPDLPPTQSVRYLLIAAFLRGNTNPPPENWFTHIETWNRKIREEGITITVPAEAQQAILFLAPETGGDFSTLRSAVRGRPGVFVRASQDLAEAGFEQARIEKYLAAMRQIPPGQASDPKALLEHSNLLARTLNLKPNEDCFKRPPDQQFTCLTQTGNQSLLDDGHAQTIAATLANGPNADLINAVSNTSLAGAGVYSAYVGAIVDLVRITAGLHTAQYQYIPAIAFPEGESLNLRLNTPPSFHNPKSVLVIGLPAIQASTPPPLRPVEPNHISCLLDPAVVLPVEGAPLVYSTAFAHSLVLHFSSAPGTSSPQPDIPLNADAAKGGLVLAPANTRKELPASPPIASHPVPGFPTPPASPPPQPPAPTSPTQVTATIQGLWGFDPFTGPTVTLQNAPGSDWQLVSAPGTTPAASTPIAGQANHLLLTSTGTACVENIHLEPGDLKAEWKPAPGPTPEPSPTQPDPKSPQPAPRQQPNLIDLTLDLQHTPNPGDIHLAIQQFGQPKPDALNTRTFSDPAKLTAIKLYAGDTTITLSGTSLDQVQKLELSSEAGSEHNQPARTYTPEKSGSPEKSSTPEKPIPEPNTLTLALPPDEKLPALKPGEHFTAHVTLDDGRTLSLPATVDPPRPTLTLLGKHIDRAPSTPIQLASPDDLPLDARLLFSLKSPIPLPRSIQIEIASPDGSLHTTLSLPGNTLVLQDAHTLLATLDPLKAFGTSAFGPIRLRAITPSAAPGDWIPLATLVRLPTLSSLTCPPPPHATSAQTRHQRPAPPATISAATPPPPDNQAATTAPSSTDAPNPTPPASAPTPTCSLAGTNLYLIESISTTPTLTNPTPIPEGFVDTSLPIPQPSGATFYLRLRDDPTPANPVSLPIQFSALPPS